MNFFKNQHKWYYVPALIIFFVPILFYLFTYTQKQIGAGSSDVGYKQSETNNPYSFSDTKKESEDKANIILSQNPKDSHAWAFLGKKLFEKAINSEDLTLKEKNALIIQSITYLEKAIEYNPENTLAVYQLGVQLISLNQKTAGYDLILKAKEILNKDTTLNSDQKRVLQGSIEETIIKYK